MCLRVRECERAIPAIIREGGEGTKTHLHLFSSLHGRARMRLRKSNWRIIVYAAARILIRRSRNRAAREERRRAALPRTRLLSSIERAITPTATADDGSLSIIRASAH